MYEMILQNPKNEMILLYILIQYAWRLNSPSKHILCVSPLAIHLKSSFEIFFNQEKNEIFAKNDALDTLKIMTSLQTYLIHGDLPIISHRKNLRLYKDIKDNSPCLNSYTISSLWQLQYSNKKKCQAKGATVSWSLQTCCWVGPMAKGWEPPKRWQNLKKKKHS